MWPLATVSSGGMNRPDRSCRQDEEDSEAVVIGEGEKLAVRSVVDGPCPLSLRTI